MFRNLSFQKKTFIYYSCFIITMLLLLTIIVYTYISRSLHDQSAKAMKQTVEKITSLLDSSVLEIDRISMQIYFNSDVQDMLSNALYFNERDSNYFDYNIKDNKKIRAIFTSINFYKIPDRKIAVFNDNLSFISSGTYPENASEFKRQMKNTDLIKKLKESPTKSLLLPPHKDWWSNNTAYPVVSILKEVFNTLDNSGTKSLGYIDVQLPYKEIREICSVNSSSKLKVLVLNKTWRSFIHLEATMQNQKCFTI